MTNANLQRAIENLNMALLDLHDNDLFCQSINDAVWILGLKTDDIRNEFVVSVASFTRWMDGTLAPLPIRRAPIYEYLLGKAHQLLKDANG